MKSIDELITICKQLQAEAQKMDETFTTLEKAFNGVDSRTEYFAIVRQAIESNQKLQKFFEQKLANINDTKKKSVEDYLNKNPESSQALSIFPRLFHANSRMNLNIQNTNERITQKEVSRELSPAQAQTVSEFINKIKELEVIADLIHSDSRNYKIQLGHVISEDEINKVEKEIEQKNTKLLDFFQKNIHYPEDENVATALVNYFEKNPRAHSIMKSFNFLESLNDAIYSARAKAWILTNEPTESHHSPKPGFFA